MAAGRLLIPGIVAATAVVLAAPALAGDPVNTTVAKPGGEFDGSVVGHIPKGATKSFRLRTENPTGSQITATLEGDPGNHTKVKWFKGQQNITRSGQGWGTTSSSLMPAPRRRSA